MVIRALVKMWHDFRLRSRRITVGWLGVVSGGSEFFKGIEHEEWQTIAMQSGRQFSDHCPLSLELGLGLAAAPAIFVTVQRAAQSSVCGDAASYSPAQ